MRINARIEQVENQLSAPLQVLAFHRGELEMEELSDPALEIILWGWDPDDRARRRIWNATLAAEENEALYELMQAAVESGEAAAVYDAIYDAAARDQQEATRLLRQWMRGRPVNST